MSNQIETSKNFQDKMKDRIKESIGDLLTDEDLEKLIERGMYETFFEKRRKNVGSTQWPKYEEQEPWIHEVLKELMTERVDKALEKWMIKHEVEMKEMFYQTLEDGALSAILKAFSRAISAPLYNAQNQLTLNLEKLLERN